MQLQRLLRSNPFIRILLFYALGILLARFSGENQLFYAVLTVALLLFAIPLAFSGAAWKYAIPGTLLNLTLLAAGLSVYLIQNFHQQLPSVKTEYQGRITSRAVEKENTFQVDCRIVAINSQLLSGDGELCRLYMRKQADVAKVLPGDSIHFVAKPQTIKNTGIPYEFDYARYMEIQGIQYMAFLDTGAFALGGNAGTMPVLRLSSFVQSKIIELFTHIELGDDELGVLSALIAGERNLLPDETKANYAAAGAMHILAVSGLHVGILFLFLNLIFNARNQTLPYRIFRLLVILAILWFYAFITGLSPSVLRATIMFSLFNVGKSFKLSVSSYNILAASALLILSWNPNELFMVGFQFSYLAVFGILFFQPRIEKLLVFNNMLADRTWQLLTVGFAAQLSTFPLSLYYFHQFPVYFWLTNLFIIPLVWAIMVLTIVFSLSLPIPALAKPIGLLLGKVVQFNNYLIEQISNLPGSVITNIRFESYHLVLFSALVMSLMFLRKKQLRYILPAGLFVWMLTIAIDTTLAYTRQAEKELWIYSSREGIAMSYICGHNHIFMSKSQEPFGNEELKPFLNFWRNQKILEETNCISLNSDSGQSVRCGDLSLSKYPDNFRMRVGNSSIVYFKSSSVMYLNNRTDNPRPDLLIVDRESGYPAIEKIEQINPKAIVAHNSMPAYLLKKWLELAQVNNINFIDLNDYGSYKLRLE